MTIASPRSTVIAWFLLAPALSLAQATPPAVTITTLTVKGYTGQAPVIQVNGKSYVEIESLARLSNGTLSFKASQVTLSMSAAVSAPPPADHLSKEFIRAMIDELSAIAEWRTELAGAIQSSNPLAPEWANAYRRNAGSKLALAATAVTTDPDRNLLPLLRSALESMQGLNDRYVTLRKDLTFVSPDAMDSDPLNQHVQKCAQGLAALTAGGPFQDVAACH